MGFSGQVLGDWVVVRPTVPEVRPDGLVVPNAEKPVTGEVVSAGKKVQKMGIGIGSLVLWEKHAGQPIRLNEEDLLVMQAHNLVAVIYPNV